MMIQQGVSVGGIDASGSGASSESGMTIGKVMDWIEARMEAIKSREEEEEEEEEKEKEREKAQQRPAAAPAASAKTDVKTSKSQGATAVSSRVSRDQVCSLLPFASIFFV